MSLVRISIGNTGFVARLERDLAPRTTERFEQLLPYRERIIHARWSGEGCWIPLGSQNFDLPFENHTSHPAPGQFIFYPGGYGETEILLAYGGVRFASKVGQLAGNHFLTIIDGIGDLPQVGHKVLWDGAQNIMFDLF